MVGGSDTCYYKNSVTVHGLQVVMMMMIIMIMMMMQPDRMEEVWARTQDTHLCDSLLFSFMTLLSRVIEFLRNLFRI